MTWTYDGAPGTSDAAGRRDSVRFLVGDTDTNDQQVTDEEITFALNSAADDVYLAAAITARAISGKYARRVDTSVESIRSSYSQLRENYLKLAQRLEKQAKKYGSVGMGVPVAGGISVSEIDSNEENSDRPDPAFRRRMFRNPPDGYDEDDYSLN